jgi:outer membrane protein
MKIPKSNITLSILLLVLIMSNSLYSQRVAFINSQMIRSKYPESQAAEQRIRSFVDEWKREMGVMQKNIDNLEFEISKNRLIWTEEEKGQKEKDLISLKEQYDGFAKAKFSPNGEYDIIVKQIMLPIDQKIAVAVQGVANSRKFDIVFDQSIQPLAYVNFKFDLTLEVLKQLGVDVSEFEKELQDKIQKDPANVQKESVKPRKVSRTKKQTDTREMERTDEPPTNEPPTEEPPVEVPKK